MLKMNTVKKAFAFVITGLMLASLAGCSFNLSPLGSSKAAAPAEDSTPIHGSPKIAEESISLPCTVRDLKNTGFETDYIVEDGSVKFWHTSEELRGNNLNMYVYPDEGYGYKDKDLISDSDTIVAIKVTSFDHIDFDFNGIRIWMDKEDFLNIAGTPAYERSVMLKGDYYFYLGDNDQVYRFQFLATDKLEEFLVGTSDYMIDEKGQPYTG